MNSVVFFVILLMILTANRHALKAKLAPPSERLSLVTGLSHLLLLAPAYYAPALAQCPRASC